MRPPGLDASHRVYGILDLDLLAARSLGAESTCTAWLSAGIRIIQLRAKTSPSGPVLERAERLSDLCRQAGAIFIVNDRADIARLSGADGVHVGQDDLSPAQARMVLHPGAMVGISTHNAEQLTRAVDEAVDYVAIGPVFATSSKERPDPVVGLDGVRLAHSIATPKALPVVAIGGITLDRAPLVIEAGAHSVAVISDLLSANAETRARDFLRAIR